MPSAFPWLTPSISFAPSIAPLAFSASWSTPAFCFSFSSAVNVPSVSISSFTFFASASISAFAIFFAVPVVCALSILITASLYLLFASASLVLFSILFFPFSNSCLTFSFCSAFSSVVKLLSFSISLFILSATSLKLYSNTSLFVSFTVTGCDLIIFILSIAL